MAAPPRVVPDRFFPNGEPLRPPGEQARDRPLARHSAESLRQRQRRREEQRQSHNASIMEERGFYKPEEQEIKRSLVELGRATRENSEALQRLSLQLSAMSSGSQAIVQTIESLKAEVELLKAARAARGGDAGAEYGLEGQKARGVEELQSRVFELQRRISELEQSNVSKTDFDLMLSEKNRKISDLMRLNQQLRLPPPEPLRESAAAVLRASHYNANGGTSPPPPRIISRTVHQPSSTSPTVFRRQQENLPPAPGGDFPKEEYGEGQPAQLGRPAEPPRSSVRYSSVPLRPPGYLSFANNALPPRESPFGSDRALTPLSSNAQSIVYPEERSELASKRSFSTANSLRRASPHLLQFHRLELAN